MNISYLTLKEISHHKLQFLLGLLAVTTAVTTVVAVMFAMRAFDLQTEKIVAEQEEKVTKEMNRLENEMRKITKGLGFNIYIFPEGQNLNEVYAEGYASKTMPESYVTKLAKSDIVTVNHLLPSLTEKIEWKEHKRTIMLIGIRGEIPMMFGAPKKPLINPVKEGGAILGYELHNSLSLKQGDTITIKDRQFTIQGCNKKRGNIDDISIWINLSDAQEMLNKKDKINAILALECNCSSVDRLAEIRQELTAILPGTTIIEKESKALARAEAREQAKRTAIKQIKSIKQHRSVMKNEKNKISNTTTTLIVILAMGFIAYLTFMNVKERVSEIGILLAVGNSTPTILVLFMARAVIMGISGAVVGIVTLIGFYYIFVDKIFAGVLLTDLFDYREVALLLIAAPLLTCAAAWLPAFSASQKDPAAVLRHK